MRAARYVHSDVELTRVVQPQLKPLSIGYLSVGPGGCYLPCHTNKLSRVGVGLFSSLPPSDLVGLLATLCDCCSTRTTCLLCFVGGTDCVLAATPHTLTPAACSGSGFNLPRYLPTLVLQLVQHWLPGPPLHRLRQARSSFRYSVPPFLTT